MTACALCSANGLKSFRRFDAKTGTPLELAVCQSCSLIQQTNRPSDAELSVYYSHHYRQDYKKAYRPRSKDIWRAGKVATSRLLFLEAHGPGQLSGRTLLDVGAGGGEFVYLAQRRGFQAQGLEPNIGYSAFALSEYGISIRTESIESLELGSADIVSIFHVLEHLPNPTSALKKIFDALRRDGLLFIEVPNILQFDASPHNIFFRAHLFYFSLATLQSMASPYFELIAFEDQGNLRVLLKKRPVLAPLALPPKGRVYRDLSRYYQKGWWTYLTKGKGYKKLIGRPRKLWEEYSIRSHAPKAILNALHERSLAVERLSQRLR
jgi:2-polyprenyl-3-methyl-5-hydroxy-6-metoxy-1,4-benzoquinol methylase